MRIIFHFEKSMFLQIIITLILLVKHKCGSEMQSTINLSHTYKQSHARRFTCFGYFYGPKRESSPIFNSFLDTRLHVLITNTNQGYKFLPFLCTQEFPPLHTVISIERKWRLTRMYQRQWIKSGKVNLTSVKIDTMSDANRYPILRFLIQGF